MSTKQFAIYKSSAGTGKTHTLVRSYLELIIQNPKRYKRILAITFTNAAANEMKVRIIDHLEAISALNPNRDHGAWEMIKEICKTLQISEQRAIDGATEALQFILHDYSSFAVGTIDSFTHRLVRTFAHDLNLPPAFEVELDADSMLENAVDQMISKAPENRALTQVLEQFSASNLDEEKSWEIEKEIITFANILLREEGIEERKQLRDYEPADILNIRKKIAQKQKKEDDSLKQIAKETLLLIKNHGLESTDLAGGKNGIFSYFRKFSEGDFSKIEGSATMLKNVEAGKWASGSAKKDRDKLAAIEQISGELEQAFLKLKEQAIATNSERIINKLFLENSYQLAIMNELERAIEELREENNIVHISEFNKRISKIVENDHVPFIYERLGERYKHFLIDEFQDTSIMQWHNLLPLITNALSEGFEGSTKEVNKSLVVGDAKQAIYRFRSGDVDQFIALPNLPNQKTDVEKTQERTLLNNYREEELDTNYRSGKEIVDFNSAFFGSAAAALPENYQKVYSGLQQQKAARQGGYVQVDFMPTKENLDEQMLLSVEKTIHECLEDGFTLSDIAIMCRAKDKATAIATYLMEQNIDVISSESLLLSSSPEVRFLSHMVQLIAQPDHPVLRLYTLNYLSSCLESKTETPSSLITRNINAPTSQFFTLFNRTAPEFSLEKCERLPIFQLVDHLIFTFSLAEKSPVYIRFFRDALLNAIHEKAVNLSTFKEWWEEKRGKLSVIIPEGTDAVEVMTIHKSKGLAFPVVINPFVTQIVKVDGRPRWIELEENELGELPTALIKFKKDIQETRLEAQYNSEAAKDHLDLLNLLYVAFTRPKERLYIFAGPPSKSYSSTSQKSIPDMLAFFLNQNIESEELLEQYTFGKRGIYISKKIRETSPFSSLGPTNPEESQIALSHRAPLYWSIDDPLQKNREGLLVHRLLASVKTEQDILPTVKKAIEAGLIPKKQAEHYSAQIFAVVKHPLLAEYFDASAQIFNEKDILLPSGHTLRPDKVVIKNEEVTLIDYKTGQFHESFIAQLDTYSRALEQMGLSVKNRILVFIGEEITIQMIEEKEQ